LGIAAALLLAGSVSAAVQHAATSQNKSGASGANVDWPVWGGTSDNTHYSPLTQINASNVKQLGVAWTQQEGKYLSIFENDPVVVNGVLYYTTNLDQVRAVKAATGQLLWQYTPKVDFYKALGGGGGGSATNRGVAVANGKVYLTTFDARLIALQAATGEKLWESAIADPTAGYSESSFPTYWNGMLFVGSAGGDSGARGFVVAYDAKTGKQVWRFYTVPAPGQGWVPAKGYHGGGDVWMPPTIDATSGLLYFGTGNPSPDFLITDRPGCNQWADAVVALNARTGKLVWAHSEVCNDAWDYDSMPSPYVFNLAVHGQVTRVMGHHNKSSVITFYDAATGKIISQVPHLSYYNLPHPKPTAAGVKVCPGTQGGTEFAPAAFSPQTDRLYIDFENTCMIMASGTVPVSRNHQRGQQDFGGLIVKPVGPATGGVAAIDPHTARVLWRAQFGIPAYGGTLATAGGLVFSGDDNGFFNAIDATTGKILWKANLGIAVGGAPIAFAVNGTEYIAVAVGGTGQSALVDKAKFGGTMVVFKLGGKPASKLPVVTAPVGQAKLPTLQGYTRVNQWTWANVAKKIAVFQVIAAQTGVNTGFNYDGYANGRATFTVPAYWSVYIEYKNMAGLPHSVAVADGHMAPAKVEYFGGIFPAESANANLGIVTPNWQLLSFNADHPGHFYLDCLVPGHLTSGMWDNFVISSTAIMPSMQHM
jgi:PQQ-dependent dehydrogenase (methanol/ethanol family)